MIFKQSRLKSAAILGALTLAAVVGLLPGKAEARFFVGIGIGVPFYAPWPYYYGPPVVAYAPPPVVYAPPAPAYPPAAYAAQAPQFWYYCDDLRGYYPNVASCPTPWREVPATPSAGGR